MLETFSIRSTEVNRNMNISGYFVPPSSLFHLICMVEIETTDLDVNCRVKLLHLRDLLVCHSSEERTVMIKNIRTLLSIWKQALQLESCKSGLLLPNHKERKQSKFFHNILILQARILILFCPKSSFGQPQKFPYGK